MLRRLNRSAVIPWITALILTTGCDERVTQVAREAADRQAQQNTTMAELHKEVAGGTRELVAADAQARKEIVGVHRDLQAERTRLDSGWSALDEERRQMALQRRNESLLVPLLQSAGLVALVIVLLGFCWYALVAIRRGDGVDAQLNELLLEDVLPEVPPQLPGRERLPSLLNPPPHRDRPAE